MIEVELKFAFTDDILQKLKDFGAVFEHDYTFCDKYYDTADFQLVLSDYWLRQRNGNVELKCPPRGSYSTVDGFCGTAYREVHDVNLIGELLEMLFNGKTLTTTFQSFFELVDHYKFQVFAEIHTRRKSFRLKEFCIVLDYVGEEYQVGEIETMVEDEAQVSEERQKIQSFAQRIGFCTKTVVPGKMDAYLSQHYPELLKRIRDIKFSQK